MAQMVKALRMILGMDSYKSTRKQPVKRYVDVEVEDDAPKRKPSLEEIDALEVLQAPAIFIDLDCTPLHEVIRCICDLYVWCHRR